MSKPLLSRKTLMGILVSIQNLARNWDRDIVTFSAFLDDEELGAHIMREFTKLSGLDRVSALSSAKQIVGA